jgi:hypothetical protein
MSPIRVRVQQGFYVLFLWELQLYAHMKIQLSAKRIFEKTKM